MATKKYADRGFLYVNGILTANIKSIKVTIDESVTVVDTMTANKRSSGFKQGNRKVSGSFDLEVEDQRPSIDMAFLYGQDVSVIFQMGTAGDRWQLTGLTQGNQDMSTSVGDSGKTINFMALDAINENGPTVNAQIGF